MKQDPSLSQIPVVVLTTSSAHQDIQSAYQLHANCYVQKSSDLEEMFERIRTIEAFWLTVATLPTAPSAG
jgi:two-component system, chemotaxis family, response regulator Rcp1